MSSLKPGSHTDPCHRVAGGRVFTRPRATAGLSSIGDFSRPMQLRSRPGGWTRWCRSCRPSPGCSGGGGVRYHAAVGRPRAVGSRRPTAARWCNGSTRDFGSLCLGSNPSRAFASRAAAHVRRERRRRHEGSSATSRRSVSSDTQSLKTIWSPGVPAERRRSLERVEKVRDTIPTTSPASLSTGPPLEPIA